MAKSPWRRLNSMKTETRSRLCSGMRTSINSVSRARRLVQSPKEIGGRDRAPAAHAFHDNARLECKDAGRQLGRRIGKRNASPERSAIANRHMRHMRHRLRNQGQALRDNRRAHHLGMSRKRADAHAPAGERDPVERVDTVDVDQETRLCQSHVEHGHEALPPGQDARVVAVLRQQGHDVIEALWPHIAESRSLHAPFPVMLSGGSAKCRSSGIVRAVALCD